jgi:hypothetical protein
MPHREGTQNHEGSYTDTFNGEHLGGNPRAHAVTVHRLYSTTVNMPSCHCHLHSTRKLYAVSVSVPRFRCAGAAQHPVTAQHLVTAQYPVTAHNLCHCAVICVPCALCLVRCVYPNTWSSTRASLCCAVKADPSISRRSRVVDAMMLTHRHTQGTQRVHTGHTQGTHRHMKAYGGHTERLRAHADTRMRR